MARLLVARPSSIPASAIGAFLASPPPLHDAEGALLIAEVEGDAISLGSFEVAQSTIDRSCPIAVSRRSTGGPPIRTRAGQVHFALHLRSPSVLGGVADPNRALNRHVRPLLHALQTIGAPATSGGRDIVLVRGAPVAWIGVRHSRKTSELGIEAIVSIATDFAIPTEIDLAQGAIAPRFLGKTPTTLPDLEASRVLESIVETYRALVDGDIVRADFETTNPNDPKLDEPPFDAMIEEAIGLIGARIDDEHVHLGGDLMASHDAIDELGAAIHRLGPECDDAALFSLVDRHLAPSSGAMLAGVRSLTSIAKVVRAAWATKTKTRG